MRQLSAVDASTANSTARLFSTGSGPGIPKHTGQTWVLGGSPKWVEQPQKILVLVSSWTWTSKPITGSYLERTATGASGVVAIMLDYSDLEWRFLVLTRPGEGSFPLVRLLRFGPRRIPP